MTATYRSGGKKRERALEGEGDRVASARKTLLEGGGAEIPAATWQAFVATGTVHLLAISGMHVTAFAAGILAALGAFYRLPLPPALYRARELLTAGVTGLGTTGYAWLAGASVPPLPTLAGVLLLLALRAARRHVRPAAITFNAVRLSRPPATRSTSRLRSIKPRAGCRWSQNMRALSSARSLRTFRATP